MDILQQTRTVSYFFEGTSSQDQSDISMLIGEGEIAELLASKFQYYIPASQTADMIVILHRRHADKLPTTGWNSPSGGWVQDPSTLDSWLVSGDFRRASEGILRSGIHYQVYPKGIYLIRNPSLVWYGTTGSVDGLVTLWYRRLKASKDDLAKLMAKDHA